jgi:transposase
MLLERSFVMVEGFLWASDEQFALLSPCLPTDLRSKPRVDDRRVIIGIFHVVKSGGRWINAPACYGQ